MKRSTSRAAAPRSIKGTAVDGYLTTVPAGARTALRRLRTTIRAAAPGATELISYRIPVFKYRGRLLVGFAAFKTHCSFFVMSTKVTSRLAADLKGYDTAKGTIHFAPDKPLPPALVRKVVQARIAENERPRPR